MYVNRVEEPLFRYAFFSRILVKIKESEYLVFITVPSYGS